MSVGALLVVALALGQAVERFLPSRDDTLRPFERAGVVGEPLSLRYGTIEVGQPDGSTVLHAPGGVYSTTGVYVVVPITFTAKGEPQPLAYVAIRDAEGRVYRAGSRRNPWSMLGAAQPGIPRQAQIAVELPVDAVAGAQVVLAPRPNDMDHRRDDVAVVDLGLTATDAQEWATDDDGVTLEPAYDGERPPS
ncbi:hypothetical protein [Phytoactinopolyspora limicola]|uniref:hypothetical protein n=1 Tax=Phytoactinopolyspora limicola TaxID=2715536 RepID=UPI0014074659|nr:hypothetical protein [Phytoactinopolyspora limicola]